MIYACQDVDFDVRAGLRSVPALFGIKGALRLAALCHVAMVPVVLGVVASRDPGTGTGLDFLRRPDGRGAASVGMSMRSSLPTI